jgi:hypothetical protein
MRQLLAQPQLEQQLVQQQDPQNLAQQACVPVAETPQQVFLLVIQTPL